MTPHHTTPSYERAREYGAHTDTHWRFHLMLPHDGALLGISQFLLLVACFHAWFSEPVSLSQAIRASSCVLKRVTTSMPHAANQVWIAAGRVILQYYIVRGTARGLLHSGRNQGFLSNGCIGCIYLVKILAHCAMLQCMSRYNKPPWVALTTTASLTITIKLGAIKYFLSIIQKYL